MSPRTAWDFVPEITPEFHLSCCDCKACSRQGPRVLECLLLALMDFSFSETRAGFDDRGGPSVGLHSLCSAGTEQEHPSESGKHVFSQRHTALSWQGNGTKFNQFQSCTRCFPSEMWERVCLRTSCTHTFLKASFSPHAVVPIPPSVFAQGNGP